MIRKIQNITDLKKKCFLELFIYVYIYINKYIYIYIYIYKHNIMGLT